MALTQDDVLNILKLVDEAPIGRFSLQIGDVKLELVKGNAPPAGSASAPAVVASVATSPVPAVAASVAAPAPTVAVTPSQGPTIKAPLLGIFYRRPEPGAAPYVEEGALVDEDTTVALIEVMKLFNPVKAGIKGRIRRVCVENGALVEYQQDLFEIEPA